MSRELLLENFDRILAAPCAIPRLRQFIYALALRGELTSQDAADTPSEDILLAIVRQHKAFSRKRIQRCDKDEATRTSAALPSSWQSVCVEEIAELRSGIAIEQHLLSDKGSIPYVKVSDLSIEPNADEVVTSSRFAGPEFKNQCIEAGSLIFPKRGGAIATNRKKVAAVDLLCDSNLMTLKPRIPEIAPYLFLWFRSIDLWKLNSGTSVPQINNKDIYPLAVPLPPIEEQARIVRVVAELNELLNRVEGEERLGELRRDRLVTASLHALTNDDSSENGSVQSFNNAARFCINHFPRLTARPEHVQQLRVSILDLAVRGRIVRSEEEDDSADTIVERVREERERRIAERKLKPVSPLRLDGTELSASYQVPTRWRLCYVDEIALKITDGEHLTPRRSRTGRYLLSARNVTDSGIDVRDVDFVPEEEYARIRKRCDPDKGDVLISCSGSVGRVSVVDEDDKYVMVRSAALVKLYSEVIEPEFVAIALRSPAVQQQIVQYSKATAQANLFIGAIRKLMIPVPPLAEQRRIVAKVKELSALCDTLSSCISKTSEQRRRLLEATFAAALICPTSEASRTIDLSQAASARS